MNREFVEKRPTVVSVIGWVWIILGAMMLLSATGALIAQATMPQPDPTDMPESTPFAGIWQYMVPLAIVQVVFAATGVFAGVRFLALHAWARTVLEGLSWALVPAIVLFVVGWVQSAVGMGSEDDGGQGTIFAFMGVAFALMYGSPLGVMIYHLRGAKVRAAVAG